MKLPFSNFNWVSKPDLETLEKSLKYSCLKQREILEDVDLSDIFPEDIGYYIELDLEYPRYLNKNLSIQFKQSDIYFTYSRELHDFHSDLPLAPSRRELDEKNLSSRMKAGMFQAGESSGFKSTKLVADLEDKQKYVVHSSVLSTYIKLGLNVTKVYR